MKITDRMCNVVVKDGFHYKGAEAKGVFKEHSQPTTDSDYSVPGYCTLSLGYDDYYNVFGYQQNSTKSLQRDADWAIAKQIRVYYEGNLYPNGVYRNNDPRYREFVVRAVAMARNYRTHEVDHVVLTLEEINAYTEQGGSY